MNWLIKCRIGKILILCFTLTKIWEAPQFPYSLKQHNFCWYYFANDIFIYMYSAHWIISFKKIYLESNEFPHSISSAHFCAYKQAHNFYFIFEISTTTIWKLSRALRLSSNYFFSSENKENLSFVWWVG